VKIAIASGKGGTGKTTVATNLALIASRQGHETTYIDCDVEEPNGHLFLGPSIQQTQISTKRIPTVDQEQCIRCGKCAEICQYGAIASLPNKTIVFPELCHACGGCQLVCRALAIRESRRPIGEIRHGEVGTLRFIDGTLGIGEAMSPPLIAEVKEYASPTFITIIDSPPGTSCPVIESLRSVDFVLLVTEPTPFGLHDLKLAAEMIEAMNIPCGVAINRSNAEIGPTHDYCKTKQIDIFMEFPDDRAVAEAYSRGEMICDTVDGYRSRIEELLDRIMTTVNSERGEVL